MELRSVNFARLCYLFIFEIAGVLIALSTQTNEYFKISINQGLWVGLGISAFFIMVESLMKGFTLRGFSTATFGILVGLLCAWLVTRVGIDELIQLAFDDEKAEAVTLATRVGIFGSLAFIGAALALRSAREDFAFIIPYVRFRSDSLGGKPMLLDSNVVVDGRVNQLMKTGFLPTNVVIPNFELDEIQRLSEDANPKSVRDGKRGLLELENLRRIKNCELTVHDSREIIDAEEKREKRLIQVARLLGARLLTTSDELTQLARLQHVDVLNLNELQDSLTAPVSVGQKLRVHLVKTGKDAHQAVGYHQDGTMIIVNHAVDRIGSTVLASVVGSLDTASGQLFFAELA